MWRQKQPKVSNIRERSKGPGMVAKEGAEGRDNRLVGFITGSSELIAISSKIKHS